MELRVRIFHADVRAETTLGGAHPLADASNEQLHTELGHAIDPLFIVCGWLCSREKPI